MAHWKYPAVIKPYSFNWNEMVRYTGNIERNNQFGNKWTDHVAWAPSSVRLDIARLMERLGFNAEMSYNCEAEQNLKKLLVRCNEWDLMEVSDRATILIV